MYRIPVYRISMVRDSSVPSEVKRIMTPNDAVGIVRSMVNGLDRETFLVLLLDCRNRVIGVNTVSIGNLTGTLVHPREVFKPAILGNAAAVILAHNHPSGDPAPSPDDIALTMRLREAGELLAIGVLDHIIVGEDGAFTSFKNRGLL